MYALPPLIRWFSRRVLLSLIMIVAVVSPPMTGVAHAGQLSVGLGVDPLVQVGHVGRGSISLDWFDFNISPITIDPITLDLEPGVLSVGNGVGMPDCFGTTFFVSGPTAGKLTFDPDRPVTLQEGGGAVAPQVCVINFEFRVLRVPGLDADPAPGTQMRLTASAAGAGPEGSGSGAASTLMTIAPSDYGIGVSSDRRSIWANGREKATLTVRVSTADGAPVPDATVTVAVDNVTDGGDAAAFTIVPTQATTNMSGDVDVAVSGTVTGTYSLRVSATDPGGAQLTTSVTYRLTRHKMVVRLLGINTSLQCAGPDECRPSVVPLPPPYNDNAFHYIDDALIGNGFAGSDLLWYSYRGGTVTPEGNWRPREYKCGDTSERYAVAVRALRHQVVALGNANPNTDIWLIGHSQGGFVAFQELGYLSDLAGYSSRVAGVITLDSPLGGSGNVATMLAAIGSCWGAPAAAELTSLYYSTADHANQGSSAQPGCRLASFGTEACSMFPTNATMASAAMAGASPVSVTTFGHHEDGIYNNRFCGPGGLSGILLAPLFFSEFVSTQVVSEVGGGGLRGIPDASKYEGKAINCVKTTHRAPFTLLMFDVADAVGDQIG